MYTTAFLLFCFVGVGAVCGYLQPQLSWKFDNNASDGYTNETQSKYNNRNRGLLLQGTSIIQNNSSRKFIYFNGNNSGLFINNITSECFAMPWLCKNGLSLNFWINLRGWSTKNVIVHSENLNIAFIKNDTLIFKLYNGSHEWHLYYKPRIQAWTCYTLTWNKTTLRFYVNSGLQAETSNVTAKGSMGILDNKAIRGQLMLGTNRAGTENTKMFMDQLNIWNDTLKVGHVSHACGIGGGGGGSYISWYKPKYFNQVFTSLDYTNKALVGHTFKILMADTIDQCIQHCFNNKNNCKSINYEMKLGSSLCELNSAEALNTEIFMRERKNFQFYDVFWTD